MTAPRVVLCGVGAGVQGRRWESNARLRAGRSRSLEITLKHASVSREHAEVAYTAEGWMLRDLGSRNGTYLNRARLEGDQRLVSADDLITLGGVDLQVAVADRASPEPVAPAPAVIRGDGTRFDLEAVTRRPWEQAVEAFARPGDERLWPARRILPLLRAGHHLTRMTSLDDLLHTLLHELVAVLGAQRGTIVLPDAVTGELRLCAVVAANDVPGARRAFSKTLADRCYREGESLLCANAGVEEALRTAQSVSRGTMTSIICALLRSPRQRLGVLHLDRGPLQAPFTKDDFDLVDAIACYVSVGIESAQMQEQQRDLFVQVATALAQTVEMRDECTGNHTQRVAAYALMLADELGLSPAERQHVAIGAALHDIGKIAVADAVLHKPGRLTADEQAEMQRHAAKGAALLENIPGLTPMLPVVRHHHERWDGTGYPDGLAGEAIPRLARVVAVADAFDAMTSDRPYRRALTADEALAELVALAGSHFDPTCVEAFLRLRPRIDVMLARQAPPTEAAGQAIAAACGRNGSASGHARVAN